MVKQKDSILLNISSLALGVEKTHNFIYRSPYLNLDPNKNYSIALLSYSMWNAYYNVLDGINNNIRYTFNGVNFDLVIPAGSYGINAINDWLTSRLIDNGHSGTGITIVGNLNTLRVDIVLEPDFNFDFLTINNNLRFLFGYDAVVLANNGATNVTYSGNRAANLSNGVDALSINCSVVDSRYNITNNSQSTSLHLFTPNAPAGSNLSSTIPYPVYLPLSVNGVINNIQFSVRDQSGNLVDLNGENVTLSMNIREEQ